MISVLIMCGALLRQNGASVVRAEGTPTITGNSIWRTNAVNATVRFLSDTGGTVYYYLSNTNETLTAADIVEKDKIVGTATANETFALKLD